MFDRLSDDVVRRVFHYLGLKERAHLSSVNRRLRSLFFTWDDVFYCSARLSGTSLAGEDFVMEIEKPLCPDSIKEPLEAILRRCPLIRKLAIHDEHILRDIDPKLLEQMTNIDELHIPSGLFGRFTYCLAIEALFSLPKLRILHIQQRYNEEKKHTNMLHFHHVENLTSTNISNVKLQGVAVTSAALEVLSFKYAKTMTSLCLIGFTYCLAIEALFSLPKLRILHIQQRYNEEKKHTNMLHFHHVENLTSTNISNVKLQGVAVTSAALEVLSFKYAKTMTSLCLIGSLVHTQDMDTYFHALS
uniref:F-box domain-containing protein n=1 Tax=Ascaris lumbricoides TaxID=6252 RepID=A0A0M3INR5_ASCLU